MFGFLKEKLDTFGKKLKNTISGKEATTKKETSAASEEAVPVTPVTEKPVQKKATEEKTAAPKQPAEKKHHEPKKEEHAKAAPKEVTPAAIEISEEANDIVEPDATALEAKLFKEIEAEIKKEDAKAAAELTAKKEEQKAAEKSEPEKSPPKKEGILTKFFGFGKKEEKPKVAEKETKHAPETIQELKEEKMQKETAEEIRDVTKAIEAQARAPPVDEDAVKVDEIESELKESGIEDTEKRIEAQEERMQATREELLKKEIKKADEDKRALKAKVGVASGLKGLVFGGVEIQEKEITDLLWELELSLLESDVEQDAAHELVSQIKKRLIGQKVSAKNIDTFLQEQIKEILKSMMTTEKINLLADIKSKKEKPYRILILGPNGAGKTTSIAKLTYLLEKHKLTAVWAAADTFRAAAIDQLEEHAKKLGVRMIKQQYGADPAAVAFDAIKAAEAAHNDVVIIDSAGRQETNKNLMEELRKLERVAKPDLTLYVGESYAGQGLLEQAKEFDTITSIDGFILTKIDTDAKGGTAISLLYKMKKPILYVGTGQKYEDFAEFTEDFIIDRII